MPNLPPHLRNLPPEPAPAAPVDKFAMPPDPTYDQSSHQLGMARPYQRPSYANVMVPLPLPLTPTPDPYPYPDPYPDPCPTPAPTLSPIPSPKPSPGP